MITVLPHAQRIAQWGLVIFWLPFFPCPWLKTSYFWVQVKIWDIPVSGLQENLTKARKTLIGHVRRVGLIEWHPTAENLLLSSAYDYNVRHWPLKIGIGKLFVKSFFSAFCYPRYSSGTCLRLVQYSGAQRMWSWGLCTTAIHLRHCCYQLALTVMAAGLQWRQWTDGSESLTQGRERFFR